jgi:hypothetical protein
MADQEQQVAEANAEIVADPAGDVSAGTCFFFDDLALIFFFSGNLLVPLVSLLALARKLELRPDREDLIERNVLKGKHFTKLNLNSHI